MSARESFAVAVAELRAYAPRDRAGRDLRIEMLTVGEWIGRAVFGADQLELTKRMPLALSLSTQCGTGALLALWTKEARALMAGGRAHGWVSAAVDALPGMAAVGAASVAGRLGQWLG